jgi:hypothetical protein
MWSSVYDTAYKRLQTECYRSLIATLLSKIKLDRPEKGQLKADLLV